MRYMGSKARIAKYIVPIIEEYAGLYGYTTYVEPFVGGANLIDKIGPHLDRYGFDINPHVIQALIDIRDEPENLIESFSKEQRDYWLQQPPTKYYSHACLVTSFGADLKGGYAREKGSDETTFCGYGKRNALKQSPYIKNVHFETKHYDELNFENAIIYCDPPYKGRSSYKTEPFDHEDFYDWCVRNAKKGNIILVSEYEMPVYFKEIWKKEIKTLISSQKEKGLPAMEKLFVLENYNMTLF